MVVSEDALLKKAEIVQCPVKSFEVGKQSDLLHKTHANHLATLIHKHLIYHENSIYF